MKTFFALIAFLAIQTGVTFSQTTTTHIEGSNHFKTEVDISDGIVEGKLIDRSLIAPGQYDELRSQYRTMYRTNEMVMDSVCLHCGIRQIQMLAFIRGDYILPFQQMLDIAEYQGMVLYKDEDSWIMLEPKELHRIISTPVLYDYPRGSGRR